MSSGDLPELTYEVLKYFQDDFTTLHSCILVNRLWCRLAIPLLWKNPFLISTKNYNFIRIYLRNLKGDLKIKLNEYVKIDDIIFPSNTLFNYPSFIKYLNTRKMFSSVFEWLNVLKLKNRSFIHYFNVPKVEKLVLMSLLQIIIENEVKLHTLDIEVAFKFHYSDIVELILKNPNFIHNIKNLKLYFVNNISNLTKNRILQIINLHQNLKKIYLSCDKFPIDQELLLTENYNCSNTLNTIIFYSVNFNSMDNLYIVFEQLNVLESVHIIYCYPLNTSFIQQIIYLVKPFKLKSLFIDKSSQIDKSLLLLLQKSGGYLENFKCDLGIDYGLSKQELLESIIKYCKNIKFLDLYDFENEIIHLPYEKTVCDFC
ncbi:hypothetical protein RclHR1_38730001 [Rhizophagus clarus]|nr:hypothetical protein RclHR1_38730001 [Rhizophagus clarus]